MNWISVDERLPEILPNSRYSEFVLIASPRYRTPLVARRNDYGRWSTTPGEYSIHEKHVTHWMPLPEAPEVRG